MLQVDTGKYGAKRQSLRTANPRDVLQKLITASPDKTEDELLELCWHRIQRSTSLMRTVYEYWFTNNFRRIAISDDVITPRRQITRAAVAKAAAAAKTQVEQVIKTRVTIKLLEMQMPSGKTLAASTKEELTALGGWVEKIAARLKPKQTVSAAGFTEQELRTLYE